MLRTPGFCACVELSDTCRLSRADSGDKKSRISFFPSTPRPRRPSSFYHWQISESERNSDYCRAWAFAARAEAKSHVPVTATTVPLVPPAPCPPPSEYADLPGLACLAAAAECRQDEPEPRPTTLATGCATETGTAHVGTAHVGLQRHRRAARPLGKIGPASVSQRHCACPPVRAAAARRRSSSSTGNDDQTPTW